MDRAYTDTAFPKYSLQQVRKV